MRKLCNPNLPPFDILQLHCLDPHDVLLPSTAEAAAPHPALVPLKHYQENQKVLLYIEEHNATYR
ncbi:hypothetical protein EON64_13425 [archaeon]|nr:MAG: hypothetical protein EON64_13425 [archaeon]